MISRWVPVVRSENGHGLATVDWERRETKRDADVDQKAEQLGGQAHARREQTGIWESRGVVWRAPPLVFTARREGRMEEEGKGVCGERRRSSEDDAATATTVDGISILPKQQQITRTVSASLGLSPAVLDGSRVSVVADSTGAWSTGGLIVASAVVARAVWGVALLQRCAARQILENMN